MKITPDFRDSSCIIRWDDRYYLSFQSIRIVGKDFMDVLLLKELGSHWRNDINGTIKRLSDLRTSFTEMLGNCVMDITDLFNYRPYYSDSKIPYNDSTRIYPVMVVLGENWETINKIKINKTIELRTMMRNQIVDCIMNENWVGAIEFSIFYMESGLCELMY